MINTKSVMVGLIFVVFVVAVSGTASAQQSYQSGVTVENVTLDGSDNYSSTLSVGSVNDISVVDAKLTVDNDLVSIEGFEPEVGQGPGVILDHRISEQGNLILNYSDIGETRSDFNFGEVKLQSKTKQERKTSMKFSATVYSRVNGSTISDSVEDYASANLNPTLEFIGSPPSVIVTNEDTAVITYNMKNPSEISLEETVNIHFLSNKFKKSTKAIIPEESTMKYTFRVNTSRPEFDVDSYTFSLSSEGDSLNGSLTVEKLLFEKPLIDKFDQKPKNTKLLHPELYEDLDGDGDWSDVDGVVSVFGELVRGKDLGISDKAARKLNWNKKSPETEVTVSDMVTLFGEKIRAGG